MLLTKMWFLVTSSAYYFGHLFTILQVYNTLIRVPLFYFTLYAYHYDN